MAKSVEEKLQDNFSLLCEIIREPSKNQKLKADLSRIEAVIGKEIPDALKKNAPEDFYVLYSDFKAEYDRFRDFILYDKLIGKNVVALGGGFSSGKSSFLNALMGGPKILPESLDPSTAVPTYIVRGAEHEAHGLNVFDAQVTLNLRRGDLRNIAHGFGEVTDEDDDRKVTDSVTLGHVLKSVFFSTPLHGYEHLAFLDTPGYSKPDAAEYSVKTDEQIARGQLNTSNFILWFVPLEKNGTISQTDIDFIRTLREDIPKMVILSQSDKKDISNLRKIIERTKADLNLKGIRYVDIRAFSSRREQVTEPELTRFLDSERAAILAQLDAWNAAQYHTPFAWNFKKLFVRCKYYYEETINEESRKLGRLKHALTILDGDAETMEALRNMAVGYQREIILLKTTLETVKRLQTEFFTEIKKVSDQVGIQMPEPAEIDLMNVETRNVRKITDEIQKKFNPVVLERMKNIWNATGTPLHGDGSIANPLLEKQTDYIQNGYFKTLALIPLAQGGEPTDGQRTLFSWLMAGVKRKFNPAIIRQAQGIEMKDYVEYMDNLKDMPLRYRFALDAILLACREAQNWNALVTAAAMLESLRIDQTTAEYLCALANSILSQDADAFWRVALMKKSSDCEETLFESYIRQFIKEWAFVSPKRIFIRFQKPKSMEAIPPDVLKRVRNPAKSTPSYSVPWSFGRESSDNTRRFNGKKNAKQSAIFENAFFPDNGWEFSNYDEITFKNCVFYRNKPAVFPSFDPKRFHPLSMCPRCLTFVDVNRIQFEECRFFNCKGIAVSEWNVQSASFEGCRFENCWLLYDEHLHKWAPLGALIHNDGNSGKNTISRSEFVNCGAICARHSHAGAILSSCKCIVRESRFLNCHHYRNTTQIDPKKTGNEEKHDKLTLFLPGTANEGNMLKDSVRFS